MNQGKKFINLEFNTYLTKYKIVYKYSIFYIYK